MTCRLLWLPYINTGASNTRYTDSENSWTIQRRWPLRGRCSIRERSLNAPFLLAICSTCPMTDCGLADKHGIQNVYEGSIIKFYCPHHGEYKVDISDDHEITRLQFSTPLRHLLRAMIFASDEKLDWVCITGANYAGYYQEQLLWCHIPQAD